MNRGVIAFLLTCGLGGCALLGSGASRKAPDERFDPGEGEFYGAEVGPDSERDRMAEAMAQDDREALPRELEAVRKLMAEAEQIRGLRFVRDFEIRVQARKAITAFARTAVDERRLQRARDAYVALGMIPAETTKAKLVREATEQADIQGYYDPLQKRLVLRDEVALALATTQRRGNVVQWRSVVVHELVHALQDQHFGLEDKLFSRRSTDAHRAMLALIEGDATLAMMQYQGARRGLDMQALVGDERRFERMFKALPSIHGVSALDAPPERNPAVFSYSAGVLFAGAIVREGGLVALNRTYRKPPHSTSDISDYSDFIDRHARPVVQSLPQREFERSGHELLHEDIMGRLELASYLSEGGAGGDILAAGWRADRLLVFKRGGSLGSVWAILMDKPEEAQAIVERSDVIGERHLPEGGTYHAFRVVDMAFLVRNARPKTVATIEKQLSRWVLSGKAVKHP